ncbi:MAG: Ger(x)C family spore germination protein [Bacillota bacterium]
MVRRVIKLITCLLLLISIASLLTGCWDYREVNDLSLVAGVVIEHPREDRYQITVESMVPRGGTEVEMSSTVFSMQGQTFFDAVRKMVTKHSKQLYWSHANILIIDEEMAREDIIPALDFANRDAEMRSGIQLLIATEGQSDQILSQPKTVIHDTVSGQIEDILNAEANLTEFSSVPLWRFMQVLAQEGSCPVLPLVRLESKSKNSKEEKEADGNQQQQDEESSGSKNVPQVYGMAVFNNKQMVGTLNEVETRSLLIILDKLKNGLVVIEDSIVTKGDVTFEIFANQTKLKPVSIDDQLGVEIKVRTKVGVGAFDSTEVLDSKKKEQIISSGEQKIERQIREVIYSVQEKYQSDIFGFGRLISNQQPEVWKEVSDNWSEVFRTLPVKVDVKFEIIGTGLRRESIKVEE